jgi:hypothetical protein
MKATEKERGGENLYQENTISHQDHFCFDKGDVMKARSGKNVLLPPACHRRHHFPPCPFDCIHGAQYKAPAAKYAVFRVLDNRLLVLFIHSVNIRVTAIET